MANVDFKEIASRYEKELKRVRRILQLSQS